MPHDGEQPTSAELDFLQHEGGESLWASKGGRRPATMKRIPTVERELARKEKALAEAAALLVLKKNSKPLEVDEDVDPDEERRAVILAALHEAQIAGARLHSACHVIGVSART